MRVDVYGIKSCDTCRKARKWLEAQGVDYQWIDLREQPPARATIEKWLGAVGAQALVNRRSTTWRGLAEDRRPGLDSPEILDLLLLSPTLIKRPLFERDGTGGVEYRVGFGDAQREWLLRQ